MKEVVSHFIQMKPNSLSSLGALKENFFLIKYLSSVHNTIHNKRLILLFLIY